MALQGYDSLGWKNTEVLMQNCAELLYQNDIYFWTLRGS